MGLLGVQEFQQARVHTVTIKRTLWCGFTASLGLFQMSVKQAPLWTTRVEQEKWRDQKINPGKTLPRVWVQPSSFSYRETKIPKGSVSPKACSFRAMTDRPVIPTRSALPTPHAAYTVVNILLGNSWKDMEPGGQCSVKWSF